jgi:hypothetical protein
MDMNVHEKMSELRREMREGMQKVLERSQEIRKGEVKVCKSGHMKIMKRVTTLITHTHILYKSL